MVNYEDGCVDCGKPCLGSFCPHRREPHYYCDECGCEDELYEFEGEELCADCILGRLQKVDGSC